MKAMDVLVVELVVLIVIVVCTRYESRAMGSQSKQSYFTTS